MCSNLASSIEWEDKFQNIEGMLHSNATKNSITKLEVNTDMIFLSPSLHNNNAKYKYFRSNLCESIHMCVHA